MPAVEFHKKNKTSVSYWFITGNDGPWQVYSSKTIKEEFSEVSISEFGIINVETGAHKKVGAPTKTSRQQNPFDKACSIANEKNVLYYASLQVTGYNSLVARTLIRELAESTARKDRHRLYPEDELTRRLEYLGKAASRLLKVLEAIDNIDAENGVYNYVKIRSLETGSN